MISYLVTVPPPLRRFGNGLEIEQPSEGESAAEITSKLIKNIKRAKKAIKHTHTKRVSSFTQTDAANDAESAGRAPIVSPLPNENCNAANHQAGGCQRLP